MKRGVKKRKDKKRGGIAWTKKENGKQLKK